MIELDVAEFAPLPLPERLRGYSLARSLDAIAPMIERARSHLFEGAEGLAKSHPGIPFDRAEIEAALARNLPEQLLIMMSSVMVLELNVARLTGRLSGATAQERFSSFLDLLRDAGYASALLEEYSGLRRQIEICLNNWVDTGLEFLGRLCDDWNEIQASLLPESPGMLTAVEGGAGDKHRGGRSVLILSFGGGARLVYKPRPMAVDAHLQEVLAWLNDRGADPRFRLLRSLDRGEYGWAEFVRAQECGTPEEVSRFYWRQGGYLALLYALEASDFHCENLIAAGEHPVLVDLETLFHPRAENAHSGDADFAAGSALGYSALKVGLLPARFWASEEHRGIDVSGLGSAAGQLTPRGIPQWEEAGSDQMRMARKRIPMPGAVNRPRLGGAEANAFDHAEEIAAGFAGIYRILLANREEFLALISRFENDEVRVVARATNVYDAMLTESYHPDLLRDDKARDELFDRLRETVEDVPSLGRLVAAEREDLRRNDIPIFRTRPWSRDLWTSSGERIENHFEETGLELVQRRVRSLSERDLERQMWIVRASLATLAPADRSLPTARRITEAEKEMGGQQLIGEAVAVGRRLEELAIQGDGDASWIGLAPVEEHEWQLAPLGLDLYDGIPGVVLFLARLGAISGDRRFSALARAGLVTLRRQVEQGAALTSIGGYSGLGGMIYALAHLAAILADDSLATEAEKLLERIPELAERDKHFDVIGGSAGCALALASLNRVRPSERITRAARACGDRLLAAAIRMDRGIGWAQESVLARPLTGFAHGCAGIAYGLLKIAELTGEARFQSASALAVEYERSLFSREHGNWPDLRERKSGDYAMAWCHGAPGIGLARLRSLDRFDDDFIAEEIQAALDTTLREGFGHNHSLCHGDLGNLEILVEADETLDDPRWRRRANRLAAAIVETAGETGWICGNPLGLESPGLMTGLAGIGYQLLRLAEPGRVPSVLSLAAPE